MYQASQELIQLVFAHPQDQYWGEGFLPLNLHGRLWQMLHQHYRTVWFLYRDDKVFKVRSFGDAQGPSSFSGNSPLDGLKKYFHAPSPADQQGEWILRQLTSEAPTALVCPLEDFCKVLWSSDWQKVNGKLRDLGRQRTGTFILTAPPEAERSATLLLKSPVLTEQLQIRPIIQVRKGPMRPLYPGLLQASPNFCLFLNKPSAQELERMLVCLCLAHSQRCVDRRTLEQMAQLLWQYLNNRAMQAKCHLLNLGLPPLRQELYRELERESVWNALADLTAQSDAAGGLPAWLHSIGCPLVPRSAPQILRSKNGCIGRLLRLPPPVFGDQAKDQYARHLMQEIVLQVREPKNQMENKTIKNAIQSFMNTWESVNAAQDPDSRLRILQAIQFCVIWLYVKQLSSQEKAVIGILEQLKDWIRLSIDYGEQRYTLKHYQGGGGEAEVRIMQRKLDYFKSTELLLDEYDDLVRSRLLEMSMAESGTSIAEAARRLQEEKHKLEEQRRQEAEPGAPEPSVNRDDMEELFGSIHPPTH